MSKDKARPRAAEVCELCGCQRRASRHHRYGPAFHIFEAPPKGAPPRIPNVKKGYKR